MTAGTMIFRDILKRVRSGEKSHPVFALLASLFMLIFWGVPLLTNLVRFSGAEEARLSFSMCVFLLFSLDTLLIMLRAQGGTGAEPQQLNLLPVMEWKKKAVDLLLLMLDHRTLLYGAVGIIFLVFFLKEAAILNALLSLLVIGVSWVTATVYAAAFLALYRNLLGRVRSSAVMVFLLLVIFFNGALATKSTGIFLHLPIVSYMGDGLYALTQGNITSTLPDLFRQIAASVVGLTAVAFIPRGRK